VYGKIAFIRTDGAQGHIYTMNPDGSDVVKVTSTIPITGFNNDYINFSWSANGSQIIYPYFDKLYQINRDGSGLTLIYKTPNGKFISECDWSNNGSTIALKTNDSNGYQVELFLISSSGVVLNTVLSGVNGAAGGLQLSVDNQKLLFTRDFSGYESGDYRQLDTRIYIHDFITNLTSEIAVQRPNGTNDLDVRFSPNEAELIFMNTSNDGISAKNVVKYSLGTSSSRTVLFTDSAMPDWK
jgi:dipeptidyl aminopeptidase/acylaminoacyl peptidase